MNVSNIRRKISSKREAYFFYLKFYLTKRYDWDFSSLSLFIDQLDWIFFSLQKKSVIKQNKNNRHNINRGCRPLTRWLRLEPGNGKARTYIKPIKIAASMLIHGQLRFRVSILAKPMKRRKEDKVEAQIFSTDKVEAQIFSTLGLSV